MKIILAKDVEGLRFGWRTDINKQVAYQVIDEVLSLAKEVDEENLTNLLWQYGRSHKWTYQDLAKLVLKALEG